MNILPRFSVRSYDTRPYEIVQPVRWPAGIRIPAGTRTFQVVVTLMLAVKPSQPHSLKIACRNLPSTSQLHSMATHGPSSNIRVDYVSLLQISRLKFCTHFLNLPKLVDISNTSASFLGIPNYIHMWLQMMKLLIMEFSPYPSCFPYLCSIHIFYAMLWPRTHSLQIFSLQLEAKFHSHTQSRWNYSCVYSNLKIYRYHMGKCFKRDSSMRSTLLISSWM